MSLAYGSLVSCGKMTTEKILKIIKLINGCQHLTHIVHTFKWKLMDIIGHENNYTRKFELYKVFKKTCDKL